MIKIPTLPAFGFVAHGMSGVRKIAENTFWSRRFVWLSVPSAAATPGLSGVVVQVQSASEPEFHTGMTNNAMSNVKVNRYKFLESIFSSYATKEYSR
jgi:hypothetical protein